MKKLYLIKERTGKWNFSLVVNGKKVLNSANQGYSRKKDCEDVATRNLNPFLPNGKTWNIIETTRKDYNKLFKK